MSSIDLANPFPDTDPQWRPKLLSKGIIDNTGEASIAVPIVVHTPWGTTRTEIHVTGRSTPLTSFDQVSIERAFDEASTRAIETARKIQQDNPDYQTPARY